MSFWNFVFSFLYIILSFHTGYAMKCFTCAFSVNTCSDLNCYNRPDSCSPKFFTSAVVPYKECPAGCEIFSISDANGIILEWRRACDLSGTTAGQEIDFASTCKTEYLFGTRFDKCTCNQDFCNSQNNLRPGYLILTNLAFLSLLRIIFQ
ncbi:uncharacterized protein LOC141852965 [Brevipalpus obovatus]|uniref:uncharacterized protein LOC141852965 n=1 Tax=Brevipalpus obovatus TaxID=246614 RepID=UPI003D9DF0AC